MDSFVLKAIAVELDAALRGGIVEKVIQPNHSMLLLEINPPRSSSRASDPLLDSLPRPSGKGTFRLLISVDPNQPRVHLTQSDPKASKSPPPFCMLLRKHLTGARIVSAALRGIERILNLTLERRDPIGRIERYTLVAEIMGRHSNLFLVDSRTGIILDALKLVPPSQSARRPIRRNMPYEPPPAQEKRDPMTIGQEAFLELARHAGDGRKGERVSARWLVENFSGISPDVAGFVVEAAEKSGLWDAFREIRDRFRAADFSPGVRKVDEADEGTVWVLPIPASKRFVPFPSANGAADELYGHSWERRRLDAQRHAVQRELQALLERKRRTAGRIRVDLGRAANAERERKRGEVLLAHLDSVPRSAESMRLTDPVTGEEVEVPLDVKLTPQQNAQRYFSKSKKLRRMAVLGEKRLKEMERQVVRLEALAAEAESADRLETLDRIAAELRELSPPGREAPSSAEEGPGRKVAAARGAAPGAHKVARDSTRQKQPAARAKAPETADKPSAAASSPAAAKPRPEASGRKREGGRKRPEKGKGARVRAVVPGPAPKKERTPPPAEDSQAPAPAFKASQRRSSKDYRCFQLDNGWEILVGKHDRGNDRLLRQVAGGEDVWLHAQGVPGSHVIIHHPERGKEVPLHVLEEAAKLAAHYSKGKESAKVAVDYTAVKHLRRVKGGRAGQVTYSGQRTILVSPEPPAGLRESDSPQNGASVEEAV
ncbi:MAG: NFACT family protein [Candidatus Tectomicrobia bacterium]|nr:NFACT family protein [Candidatus Tectomicrobia bacterium]